MNQLENNSNNSAAPEQNAVVYTVDSFSNGIAFGQHLPERSIEAQDLYYLRLYDDAEMIRLRSRYALHRSKPLFELERNLMRLSSRGILRRSEIYFGTTTDPFHPFKAKFDASIKFLDLFRRYVPGMLHVQSRSSLLVLALPVLRALGKHVSVTIGIETNSEEAAQRYTPDLPRIEERLKTASALRNFGVEVVLQVGPVLPYGDWKHTASGFAELLARHADFIYCRPLLDGSLENERQVKGSAVYKKLAADRKFHWLRPDSAEPLLAALQALAPEKLRLPRREQLADKQLGIFAA